MFCSTPGLDLLADDLAIRSPILSSSTLCPVNSPVVILLYLFFWNSDESRGSSYAFTPQWLVDYCSNAVPPSVFYSVLRHLLIVSNSLGWQYNYGIKEWGVAMDGQLGVVALVVRYTGVGGAQLVLTSLVFACSRLSGLLGPAMKPKSLRPSPSWNKNGPIRVVNDHNYVYSTYTHSYGTNPNDTNDPLMWNWKRSNEDDGLCYNER